MKTILFLLGFSLLVVNISCSQKSEMSELKNYPPELIRISDRITGASIQQLTNYKGNSHHFYFTNSGWFDNDQKLLFSSDRNNRTNLFSIDLNDYGIKQLTDLEPIPPPLEIEFFSACKNPVKEEAFFWHGTELISLDLNSGRSSVIFKRDPGWDNSVTSC